VNRIQLYEGIRVEVMAGGRNLCRRLVKNQFTLPTQAIGKCKPKRDQRKVSENASTRLNLSTASLSMIVADLGGGVQSRYKPKIRNSFVILIGYTRYSNSCSLGLWRYRQLSLANKI
jgi:hypothetical protein